MMTTTLDRCVRDFLLRAFPSASVVSIESMLGGHSGHTLLAFLEGGGPERIVVKSGAPGRPAVGRHDVLRQARLFTVLADAPGVRVPHVLAVDDGDPPQFAMTFEPGDCFEPVLDGIEGVGPSEINARARSATRMLGALHGFDVDIAPTVLAERTCIEDELDRWKQTLAVVDQTLVLGWEHLAAKLQASLPIAVGDSIVHGDYRLGNILCFRGEPTAIIDWEIWSISDPRIDLGWMLLFSDASNFPGIGHPAPGMPNAAELVIEYEKIAGPIPNISWFVSLARLKTAAVMSHNLRRHREGRYHDPYQERLPPTIASMIERAIDECPRA
jgi:aminoglycoside phosphotransferase (APT) family kinase protein